jgi:hypothetical protein
MRWPLRRLGFALDEYLAGYRDGEREQARRTAARALERFVFSDDTEDNRIARDGLLDDVARIGTSSVGRSVGMIFMLGPDADPAEWHRRLREVVETLNTVPTYRERPR